jgi:hypothetical protein
MIHIYHADHGIPLEVIGWALASIQAEGFFLKTLEIATYLPDLQSALYGPSAGDPPVSEDEAVYLQRSPDRPLSRMVHRPLRPTRWLTIIGEMGSKDVHIYTAYGGPPAMREPGDPSMSNDEQGFLEAAAFWKEHALAVPEVEK